MSELFAMLMYRPGGAVTHYQYSTGLFGVALFLVQQFLYSSGLTPKLVQ